MNIAQKISSNYANGRGSIAQAQNKERQERNAAKNGDSATSIYAKVSELFRRASTKKEIDKIKIAYKNELNWLGKNEHGTQEKALFYILRDNYYYYRRKLADF